MHAATEYYTKNTHTTVLAGVHGLESTSDMVDTEPSRLHRGGGGRGCTRTLGLECFVPMAFLLCAGLFQSEGALVCVQAWYDHERRRKKKKRWDR